MQAEVTIEVHDVIRGNRDAWALLVVQRLAMRDDHVQTVHRAALEEADEDRAVGQSDSRTAGREGRSCEEQRIQAEAYEGQSARPHEHASRNRHCVWKSGP